VEPGNFDLIIEGVGGTTFGLACDGLYNRIGAEPAEEVVRCRGVAHERGDVRTALAS
jgi:hypothetical protein